MAALEWKNNKIVDKITCYCKKHPRVLLFFLYANGS